MALTIISMLGFDISGLDPAQQEAFMLIIAAICGVLIVLFVTMIIDFLARILSRFIPRWNRNS